ncbi:MAG: hypothetical protein C4527_24590 [Candidatus Omnitrophota bacterium]|jgi:hypothetical protein|nr:MAG: hypothetical protein C4527_24590 [Candidatus Omnitrophota bacterium]
MIVRVVVEKDGSLKVKDTEQLHGLEELDIVADGKADESRNETNWPELWTALNAVDDLGIPPRNHEEILQELREFREG